jgi:hypothetical protein
MIEILSGFGERNRPGCSLTRLAANTTVVARAKMFGAGRTERQARRLRSPFSNGDRSQEP